MNLPVSLRLSNLVRHHQLCDYARMNRITLSLPEDLTRLLRREAQRQGASVSKVARRAIEQHLRISPEDQAKLPFAGLGRSGKRHVARDAEKILSREWRDARHR